jgi:hypothetical protein
VIPKMWNNLCLISFLYSAGELTDVFEIESIAKSSSHICPFPTHSRGAYIVLVQPLQLQKESEY